MFELVYGIGFIVVVGAGLYLVHEEDKERGIDTMTYMMPVVAGAVWLPLAIIALAVGLFWTLAAAIRAVFSRKAFVVAWNEDRSTVTSLKKAFEGLDARVFGSCAKARVLGFSRAVRSTRHSDIDVVVVVDLALFEDWKGMVYPNGMSGYDHSTRDDRRSAAGAVLGREFARELDVFLFPEGYLEKKCSIPVWDERFRGEVASAARRVTRLRVAPFAALRFTPAR